MQLLRALAIQSLGILGIDDTEDFIAREMLRTFSAITASLPEGDNREVLLQASIRRAIEEASA
jgi:cytochrome c-type biogenesis protein CcmH/NrfG